MSKGNWIGFAAVMVVLVTQVIASSFYLGGLSSDIKNLQREVSELRQDVNAGVVALR